MAALFSAQGLTKRFGAVQALTRGDLVIAKGEIHALMGANGSGKSTLCKAVAGTLAPDAGQMDFEGQTFAPHNPRAAEERGIALFYQELSLIPQLSVADNIFLGHEKRRFGLVDRPAMEAQSAALIALFSGVVGPALHPRAIVGDLPPDLRQIVEILKVFAKSPRLLILDEATAALDARQAARLFEILREMRGRGISTLMISHRLDEVFAVADRMSVMRNGALVAVHDTSATTRAQIVAEMVGEVAQMAPRQRTSLGVASLAVTGARNARVRDVSFTAHMGEIVGLAGLQGQGQSALLQGIFGAMPFEAGQVTLYDRALHLRAPAAGVAAGMAYISGDRGRDAGFGGRSIFENLGAALLRRGGRFTLSPRQLKPVLAEAAASLGTKYGQIEDAIGTLSGGNQQKVFIARWLVTKPQVLLLDDPTKGIDLQAKADLFALMRGLADEGATILFYSSDDSEILDNADRVLVFNGGRITASLSGAEMNPHALARAAFGEVA